MMTRRKLLFLERIMYGDGITPFNGVFALRLKGVVQPFSLREALAKLQATHPLLRAGIETDAKGRPWFVLQENSPSIPMEIKERLLDDDWIRETKAAWTTVFDTKKGPLIKVVLLTGTDRSDLIIVFHHCMCDGGGGLLLLRELLGWLDNPTTATPIAPQQHFITLQDIVPSIILNNPWKVGKAKLMGLLLRGVLQMMAAFASGRSRKVLQRENDYLLHWKWSAGDSAALFKQCTGAGVTVNTALCAAFLSAFQEVKGHQAHNKITCPVDIRKLAPQIKKDTLFSFGLALTLSLPKNKPAAFWDTAKQLQQEVARKMAGMDPYSYLMALENAHAAIPAMKKFLTYGKVGNDLMFSNMGRLEIPRHLNSFEVETVFSPTVIGPFANPTTLITSTYDGQLDFSFVSNEDFIGCSEALAIRDKAMRLLLQEQDLPVTEPVLTSLSTQPVY